MSGDNQDNKVITRRELAISQMERALRLSHFMSTEPVQVMKRLKLHTRISELYESSMYLRKQRSDFLEIEEKVEYIELKSKINESRVPTTKQTNNEIT